MPLLNFKAQFVPHIRSGRKNHTIRADRKIPVKLGDKLYLYCGLRHKGAYRILPEPVTCTKVHTIHIEIVLLNRWVERESVTIDEQNLERDEVQQLARADGFADWSEMRRFWLDSHGQSKRAMGSRVKTVNFTGQIIHWQHPTEAHVRP